MNILTGSLPLPGNLKVRFTQAGDGDLVLALFRGARPWLEYADSDTDFVRFLYEDQLRLARHGLEAHYPNHLDFIIEKNHQPVGHIVLDLGYHDWRVNVLELDSRVRGRGIGSDVVRAVQTAAARVAATVSVTTMETMTRAVNFYLTLGFRAVLHQSPMLGLLWVPPGRAWPASARAQ